MTQPDNRNKDEWIQKAKALLYDCKMAVDSDQLSTECADLIREGGGFDPLVETNISRLKWKK